MPILKKVKYDFHGNGEEMVITIKMDSKGSISADVPWFAQTATKIFFKKTETLADAEKQVLSIWHAYLQVSKHTERVIIIHFSREKLPPGNLGIGLNLNYIVADKETHGQDVSYKPVQFSEYRNAWEVSHYHISKPFGSYMNQGVIVGESTEIPFTQESYDKIADLHKRLEDLCKMLDSICGSSEGIMALIEGNVAMLLGS